MDKTDERDKILKDFDAAIDFKKTMSPKSQYDLIDECIAFYSGDQWRGFAGDKTMKPVLNIEQIIIDRKVVEVRPYETAIRFRVDALPSAHPAMSFFGSVEEALNGIVEAKWNVLGMKHLCLDACLRAAVQGMAVAHTFWDKDFETFAADAAESIKGDFRTELLNATNFYLGNPYNPDVQTQNQNFLDIRMTVGELRKLGKENGLTQEEINLIKADMSDDEIQAGEKFIDSGKEDDENRPASLIIRMQRAEDKKIHATAVTRTVTLYSDKNMKLERYPIATFLWKSQPSLGYGIPECYDIHRNQIFINKVAGAVGQNQLLTGFPKLLFDSSRIQKFNNVIGGTQGVAGEITGAASYLNPPRTGNESVALLEFIIKKTFEAKGVAEVLLGIRSADSGRSIAIQQSQAAAPLKILQERFYQFIKDICLNWFDYIKNFYDIGRIVRVENANGEDVFIDISGDLFRDMPISLSVDVGDGGGIFRDVHVRKRYGAY